MAGQNVQYTAHSLVQIEGRAEYLAYLVNGDQFYIVGFGNAHFNLLDKLIQLEYASFMPFPKIVHQGIVCWHRCAWFVVNATNTTNPQYLLFCVKTCY
jgi:hypothetical protein